MMKKTLFAAALLLLTSLSSFAQSADEKAVGNAVEKLKNAIIAADAPALDKLTSPLLSYGHSNGLLEDKKEFIRALTSGESHFTKIDLSDQTISVSGDLAIVRHKLIGDTHNKGKDPAPVKLGVFYVWQKTKGTWLLLGRQAFKLPM
ncbi:nuclear transport factor 2 family protein [Dyadobacter sp. LHD-138]|uniref:nuclear transport factor 2 family protein n=1 Tax=Dyadobacter sp. LHD-138 TaxID=3071413 RepID=UPI0027E0FBB8|nr:nuclear transport factor 2 family protein [Dyadobacter sp. LHD-138]MDQ6479727.1 nuclear transport factor 2 family protein [Dyadobacter sp. LHD-138]